jgi:hypothetical protein
LRKVNRELRMERDILKKAAAFFAEFLCDREERAAGSLDRCGEAKMELFDYIEVFYNGAGTRRSARSVRPPSSDAR